MNKLIAALFIAFATLAVQAQDDYAVWDLTDLYPDIAAWEAHRNEIAERVETLQECNGQLAKNANNLSRCMDSISNTYKDLLRLYVHAFLAKDIDLGNSELRERVSMAQTLFTRFSEVTSFVGPELIAAGERRLNRHLRRNPALGIHDFYIANTLRQAPHILSPEEEKILAAAQDALSTPASIYEVLANAEIPWPEVALSDGSKVKLNSQGYVKSRTLPNREDRQQVFNNFFGTFNDYRQTLALALEGTVKHHVLLAKTRNFGSSLTRALSLDNIPEAVYRTLVTTVNNNLDTLHQLLSVRQRLLGIEQSEYYDVYPSVISMEKTYSIEDAKRITLEAFAPLGEDYLATYRDAVEQNWMHVYPSEGKRSGAYVMGAAYDVHPYVLLNHQNDLESVSTFAHEWGHAMHSLLANENQPFTKSDYATFTAEIASIVNEVLLFDYFRANAETDEERLFFLFAELQQVRGTFFRQTQFAEFELAIHEHVEQGGALSGDKLNSLYGDILKRYYGHEEGIMNIQDTYTVEWAYIPHFYRDFYVYQYATSMAAAYYLADQIKEKGEPAQQSYLDILRAGGSDYPYDILKKAGVDMASAEVYEAVIQRMQRLLDEVEELLAKTENPS